jgi:hypothetical protein
MSKFYIIVSGDLTSDQMTAINAIGITDPRKPVDGSNLTVVAFTSVPDVFNGLTTYTHTEIMAITTQMPWAKPGVFKVRP